MKKKIFVFSYLCYIILYQTDLYQQHFRCLLLNGLVRTVLTITQM